MFSHNCELSSSNIFQLLEERLNILNYGIQLEFEDPYENFCCDYCKNDISSQK